MKRRTILTVSILGGGHAALCLCGNMGPARPKAREAIDAALFESLWSAEHGCPSCEQRAALAPRALLSRLASWARGLLERPRFAPPRTDHRPEVLELAHDDWQWTDRQLWP